MYKPGAREATRIILKEEVETLKKEVDTLKEGQLHSEVHKEALVEHVAEMNLEVARLEEELGVEKQRVRLRDTCIHDLQKRVFSQREELERLRGQRTVTVEE